MTMTAGQGSMLHLQSNMQHSPVGISIINAHTGSVSCINSAKSKFVMFYGANEPQCICLSDVSILHEWVALSRIPVSYLSLPAYSPAGVFTNPNWTTGIAAHQQSGI